MYVVFPRGLDPKILQLFQLVQNVKVVGVIKHKKNNCNYNYVGKNLRGEVFCCKIVETKCISSEVGLVLCFIFIIRNCFDFEEY